MKNRGLLVPLTLLIAPLFTSSWLYAQQTAHTIEVHAQRFSFVPAEITVTKGEPVALELISDDVPHSLVVKDLGINETITKGHTSEVTFTPANSGDFKGECGRFCGSGHGSMLFVVHVK
jgi:cytochrome c oxidase subunit 2